MRLGTGFCSGEEKRGDFKENFILKSDDCYRKEALNVANLAWLFMSKEGSFLFFFLLVPSLFGNRLNPRRLGNLDFRKCEKFFKNTDYV